MDEAGGDPDTGVIRAALIGNSNAIMHDGYSAAIDREAIDLDNVSLGASPNVLLLHALHRIRGRRYDWIIFDTSVTDFAWIDLGLYTKRDRDLVLTAFLQEVCRIHAGRLLCLVLPVADALTDGLDGAAPSPADEVRAVLRTSPRPVHLLDVYDLHRRYAPPGEAGVALMMRDRLHLSPPAQALLGRLVTDVLLNPAGVERAAAAAAGKPAPAAMLLPPAGPPVPPAEMRRTSLVEVACHQLPPGVPARFFAPVPARVMALCFDRDSTCCHAALREFASGAEIVKDLRCQASPHPGLNLHVMPILAELVGSAFELEALAAPPEGAVEPGWLLDPERAGEGIGLVGLVACAETALADAASRLAAAPTAACTAPIDVLAWPDIAATCAAAFTADGITPPPAIPARLEAAAVAQLDQMARDAELPPWLESPGKPLGAALNIVLSYGQSLSTGTSGWPALSRTPMAGNWRIGRSVRAACNRGVVAPWAPAGGAARLEPLASVVQDNEGSALLDDAALATSPDLALHDGETVLEGALADFRRCWQARDPEAAGRRGLLALAAGMPGRSIESLSPGHASRDYERVGQALAAAREAAAPRSLAVAAVLWLQGEGNSLEPRFGTVDPHEYGTLARTLLARLRADTALRSRPAPPVLTHQAPVWFASDAVGTAIAQVQLDLVWPRPGHAPGCVMACPAYFVTRRESHPDANGYRWLGAHFARVMERLLLDGAGWYPLQPLAARRGGTTVLIAFRVPHPPLVLAPPPMFADLPPHAGFACRDRDGPIAVEASVAAPHVVQLHLARAARGRVRIGYAGRRPMMGVGCLRDSDPGRSGERFEFGPVERRHLPASALRWDGEFYPLWNWCAAFDMTV